MIFRILTTSCMLLLVSCVSHDLDKVVDCNRSGLALEVGVHKASDCAISDGKVTASVMGGEKPYRFLLNDGTPKSDSVFSGLHAGIYKVTVRDKNGCESSAVNIAVEAEGFKFASTVKNDIECLTSNGSIQIDVLEGQGPFTYKLDDGDFSSNNFFPGLSPGNYSIKIKDAGACMVELHITVPSGPTDTTWKDDILPIMTSSCAVTGCHDGKTRVDYRLYSNVKKQSATVKLYTRNGRMPFDGPALTQNQIDLITCWVDDGALNN